MDLARLFLLIASLIIITGLGLSYESSLDSGGGGGGGGGGGSGGGDPSIDAGFSYNPSNPDEGQNVDFQDQSSSSSGSITSRNWDFGDGSTASGSTPTHSFSPAGNYQVNLTVQDSNGNEGWYAETISVQSTGAGSGANSCTNGDDDDGDGDADGDDPGCVRPLYDDPNEGMIFDSHFTAAMEGLNLNNGLFNEGSGNLNVDSTESLFFENTVLVGSQQDTLREETDSSVSSSSKNFYYVDAQRTESESSEAYGFGYLKEETVSTSDFSQYNNPFVGSQEVYYSDSENRFVDTPHDYSEVCGNGIEDDSQDETNTGLSFISLGNKKGYANDNEIECKGDWGRILMKYDMDGNEDAAEHNYKNDDLECANDDGDAEATGDYGSCTSACSGTNAPGRGSCSGSKQDYTDQEGTNYYLNPGDLIEEYECTRDETCNDGSGSSFHVSNSCDDSDSYSYIDSCDSSSCDCGKNCTGTSYSVDSTDTQYCGQGHIRSWSDVQDSINADDEYSVVDGGSRISDNRMGNDPAATYTKFTSYADDTWTDGDNEGTHSDDTISSDVDGTGKVWAGYDFAATVNADGPRGNNDGYIVINELAGSDDEDIDRVVGRESPNGDSLVGKNVYYGVRNAGESDGSATNQLSYDMIEGNSDIKLSCSGTSEICIKYVDFWTDGPGGEGTPGDPTWTISPSNSDNPTKSEIFGAISVDTEEYTLDKSYSVCKAANRIARENSESMATSIGWSNGEKLVDCDYMRDDNGDGVVQNISPLPQACGDEENEHLMMMEGPEVSQGTVDDYLIHEQECVNWNSGQTGHFNRNLGPNSCVLKGKAVSEGTVANVASGTNEAFTESGYEQNADSPDYEVCLDIRDGGPTTSYQDKVMNYRYNDDSQPASESYGGQWYDLDDPRVNEYLRSNSMPSPGLSTSQRSGDADFIDFYYGENPNPYHADYNPEGDKEGTSLLADCGPLVESCADDPDGRQGINADQQTYFAFFQEFVNGGPNRDEDYNPTGENSVTTIDPRFDPMGRINFIKSRSDQLSPGSYDYDEVYDDVRNNDEWWFDTEIDSSSAVQYAYTANYSWSIDSTGVPYPPAGAADTGPYVEDNTGNYYKEDYTGLERSDRSDGSVQKPNKAFGNSLAVVAQQSGITDAEGNSIAQGEGYWIDPDDTRQEWNSGNIQGINGHSDWRGLIDFKMDLSGPDSGLGWDLESEPGNIQMSASNEGYVDELKQSNSVAFADIYWQGYEGGNVEEELQAPMCGDDRYEYLLEEKGESPNSVEGSGRYSCTNSPDYCVSFTGGGSPLYEYDSNDITYKQTEEPGETESRLKNDDEACAERPSDVQPNWYDQDFGEVDGNMLCRENSLYGAEGVRWINASQISDNPLAFNDGIDDSWNPRFDQQAYSSLNSDRTGANWDLDGNILDNWTPVDTGTDSSRVADNTNGYGFCGGDDSSEYLIYQDSQAEQVETDQSVIAVSSSPDSCVLDNSRLNDIDDSDIDKGRHQGNLDVNNLQDTRMTYSEGDSVTFQSSGTSRTIQCFDGQWWGEWPIVFYEEVERFNLGETGFIPFMVINPTDSSIEFELDLNPRANNNDDRDDLTQITSFESTGSDEMSLTVPGRSSSTQRLEIAANREINTLPEGNDFEIEVIGESTEGSIVGDDQVDLVINESDDLVGSSSNIRDIPGLTFIQMIFIALASTMIFIFRN